MLPFPFLLLSLTIPTTLSPLPPADSSAGKNSGITHVAELAPILGNLGFQELAMAISSLSPPPGSDLSGPMTLFAPSDDSFRSCPSCSPSSLLPEHLVPGLFPRRVLSELITGTKIATTSPARCLTFTSSQGRLFVEGVEITSPDLFVNSRLVIHGLQGFVAPLSPLSCVGGDRPQHNLSPSPPLPGGNRADTSGPAVVRLMLRDAIVRLRDSGFSILSLAMRVKYAELAGLQNMTIFALDDSGIFSGWHSYVTSVRFHVVPNRLLMHGDLLRLPTGTKLPTLVHGQDLVITHSAGGDPFGLGMRINYVPLQNPDVIYNVKIAVHSIFLPFPQLLPYELALGTGVAATAEDGIFGPPPPPSGRVDTCETSPLGGCQSAPSAAPTAHVRLLRVDDDSL